VSAYQKANSEKPSAPDRVDPLTVGPVIKPLGKLKRAHNKLVNLIRTITCKGGLKVSISDGRLIFDASGIIGSEGAPIDVVGSDGKLNKVPKHSTWATPTVYPSFLATNNGTAQMTSTAFIAALGNYAVSLRAESGEGLYIQKSGGATYLYIQESAITKIMTVREIDVCDGGVAKKMLVIGSAPY
jgi:hypothetical protein